MYQNVYEDTGLTDEEMQHADERARSWAQRVNELMAVSGCDAWMALLAVSAADKETHE